MRDSIGCTDDEGAIKHSCQESDTAGPAGLVVPCTPYKGIAGVCRWLGRTDDDCNKAAGDDEEKADMIQGWQKTVTENNKRTTAPGDDEKRNVNMPRFDHKIWVEDGIHLDSDVGRDRNDGSQIKDPAEKVQVAGEEANNSAIAGTWSDRCPVIDTSCGWYSRCQLTVLPVSK